jgi:hypothetical protein
MCEPDNVPLWSRKHVVGPLLAIGKRRQVFFVISEAAETVNPLEHSMWKKSVTKCATYLLNRKDGAEAVTEAAPACAHPKLNLPRWTAQ